MDPLDCVAFIVVKDGKILAERRKTSRRLAPGALALPGGHVDPGETVQAALVRELREELGIQSLDHRYVCARIHRSIEVRRIHYFAIERWAGEIACLEAASLHWIPVEALDRLDFRVDREAITVLAGRRRRATRPLDAASTPMAKASARRLRAEMTDAEIRLWDQLRRKQTLGARFRRQFPIGHFIVAFVCLPARLVVEVDGGQHAAAAARDARRTTWLEAEGFTVIRFWNHDILARTESVVATIRDHLARAIGTLPPTPSRKGRGKAES